MKVKFFKIYKIFNHSKVDVETVKNYVIFVAIFWRILSQKVRILILTNYIKVISNEIWYFIKST